MKTSVYFLDLKDDPEIIEKYLYHHKNVWPEVTEYMKNHGVINYTIYKLGTRLVAISDNDDSYDPSADMNAYTENPKCKEWDDLMCSFQQKVPGAKEDEWWALTEKVFEFHNK